MWQVRYREKIGKRRLNVLLRRFKTEGEAETFKGIEYTQMEYAETQGELYIKKESEATNGKHV